jgi:hypothetical protein
MTRNIPNKPHPTPNPDSPHTPALQREQHPGPDPQAEPGDESRSQDPPYDSCFDDLNVILSQSIEQPDPDPNLQSASGVPEPRPTDPDPFRYFAGGRTKQPTTSEIFRAVGPKVAATPTSDEISQLVVDPESSREREPGGARTQEALAANLPLVDRTRELEQDVGDEEDADLPEPGVPWAHVLLLSYASAVTLALGWVLWGARAPRSTGSSPTETRPAIAASPSQTASPELLEPPPSIPIENVASLGKAIRLGGVEVTPLGVFALPLELIRAIQPTENRQENEESLALQLKITSTLKFRAFAPLDATLVRDHGVRPQDPYIVTSDEGTIRLFALAVDSEWSIRGQEFPVLQPGESAVTIIAAEPGSARRLAPEMTWRVRVRTGVYRTDMIGVRFTRDEIKHIRSVDEIARQRD